MAPRKTLVAARKKAWADRFKFNGVMRGTPLRDPAGVEARYAAALERLARIMTETTRREIEALFRQGAASGVGMDASPSSQARILTNALKKRFDQLFAKNAKPLAEKMMAGADKASKSATYMSLKELSGGLSLKTDIVSGPMREFMSAAIANNVALIKSISAEYMVKVQGAVMRSIMDGNGLQDLVPFFEAQEGITHRRAKNIALDQTRKAYNGLNKGRMEAIGVKKFEWIHSGGGQHPRELHMRMSGNIYSFDDLPVIDESTGERGIPGQAINCFTGSTQVSLANGCRNVWRHWYDGDLIVLVVNGEPVECTPNHPILTGRGWLPAHMIEQGDYLVARSPDRVDGVDRQINERVSSFDDLFVAAARSHTPTLSAPDKFNFHGDIPKSDVDCVSVDDHLPLRIEVPSPEQFEKFVFAAPDRFCGDAVPRARAEIAETCRSSGAGDFDALVGGEFGHSEACGRAAISQNDSGAFQDADYDVPRASVHFGQLEDAYTGLIGGDDQLGALLDFQTSRGSGDFKTDPRAECGGETAGAAFVTEREGAERFAAGYRGLRVEQKIVRIFSGHVYTLESETGWYEVSSAMIVSKNCRCVMNPIIEFEGGSPE